MDFDASRAIQPELGPHEQLLWAGRPIQGMKLRGSDLLFIPFSLFWGGFAVFWEYSVIRDGAPLLFAMFGSIFVLVGLYLIAGRFFVDARQRRNTFYALSNKRVIIVSGLFGKKVKSLPLRNLSEITLSESKSGKGSILFGGASFASMLGGSSWPGMDQQAGPRFDLVTDAKQVYRKIREAQEDDRRRGDD